MTALKIIYFSGEERFIENVISWTIKPNGMLVVETDESDKYGKVIVTYHIHNETVWLFYEVNTCLKK